MTFFREQIELPVAPKRMEQVYQTVTVECFFFKKFEVYN